jgi:hypothetical protein
VAIDVLEGDALVVNIVGKEFTRDIVDKKNPSDMLETFKVR